jgi:hypothetical protein
MGVKQFYEITVLEIGCVQCTLKYIGHEYDNLLHYYTV